uniref:Maleylacetoacetate isomerase n=1 Tax=Rhabditophanes sp. KR3021 TaxID=114890 RepID=A0AC35U9A5_9BILA
MAEIQLSHLMGSNSSSPSSKLNECTLEAIILVQFDDKIGPIVKYQVPRDLFNEQFVDNNSILLIPRGDFMRKRLKFQYNNYTVMGRPIKISNPSYPRHYFMFNCVFVVKPSDTTEYMYSPIVRKMSEYLEEMEVDDYALSQDKFDVRKILEEVYRQLAYHGTCSHYVHERLTIYLKPDMNYERKTPPDVNPYMVPIFTRLPPPIKPNQLNRMDLLCKKICPLINGVRSIKEISTKIEIDTDLVSRCIKNLYVYGYVCLIPVFLYSNSYVQTELIREFKNEPFWLSECMNFIKRDEKLTILKQDDVYMLYLSIRPGQTVRDWVAEINPGRIRATAQNSEEYRKINKRGYVPTLIDGKDTIVESLAIIEYLDEKHHDKTPLLPSNLVEKAKVRAVALHIISGIQPLQNLGVIAHHSSDPAEKKKWAHHWINIGFQVLEKMLSESHGKFCFGDQITIADICIPPQVYNATRFDVDMSAFPIISQINDNLSKIEAFAKAHPSAQPDATE